MKNYNINVATLAKLLRVSFQMPLSVSPQVKPPWKSVSQKSGRSIKYFSNLRLEVIFKP